MLVVQAGHGTMPILANKMAEDKIEYLPSSLCSSDTGPRSSSSTDFSSLDGSTESISSSIIEEYSSDEEDPEEPEVIYSDPLDALEKATDTRIYNCPEFGEIEEVIYEEAGKKLRNQTPPKRRKRATSSTGN